MSSEGLLRGIPRPHEPFPIGDVSHRGGKKIERPPDEIFPRPLPSSRGECLASSGEWSRMTLYEAFPRQRSPFPKRRTAWLPPPPPSLTRRAARIRYARVKRKELHRQQFGR